MTNLIKVENGKLVVSSREVAENFEKNHRDVLATIYQLIDGVAEKSADLFYPTTYIHKQNKQEYSEVLMNRDGFTLLAMGFTGKKALGWKLKYIEAFNKMEETIKNKLLPNNLSPELQMFNQMLQAMASAEIKQKELEEATTENKKEIQNMRDVIQLDTTSWRKDTAQLITKIATNLGGFEHIKDVRQQSYKLLDERMGVALSTRLTNKRRRMADEGVSKSKRDKLNYLDIIAEDKKLIEGYTAIIKEMSIKFKIA